MAQTINYDPGTIEARSSWLVGLVEACNKITGVLDMQTGKIVDEIMPELFIADDDRYRIYQVGEGKKLWLTSPAPVIKKNGVEITEATDGFVIDYLGGSIVFDDNKRLTASDTITVTATQIIADSLVVDELKSKTAQYKGAFATADDLIAEIPTGNGGDYAVVIAENSFYLWNVDESQWVTSKSEITPQGETDESDWYYYGGRNTWQDLKARVLGAVLTDLDISEVEKIEATDTIIQAFGKLQAQINDGALDLQGEGEPTTETAAKVGRDYLDTTTGKKYHLVAIDVSTGTQQYVWEQYANESDLPQFDTEPTEESTNGITSGGVYTALQEAQTTADGKYMTAENPVGTGSFSMGRQADTVVGEYSFVVGYNNTAIRTASFAEGQSNRCQSNYGHVEGLSNIANGGACIHVEGQSNGGYAACSHVEGFNNTSHAKYGHAEGSSNTVSGQSTHAEGENNVISGYYGHIEGFHNITAKYAQHVQGRYNISDKDETSNFGEFAHIVGNGTSTSGRSNAHTLRWDGTAWFAGDVYVGSTSGTNRDEGSQKLVANGDKEIVLQSSTEGSTKKFKLTIDDSGTLNITEITETE